MKYTSVSSKVTAEFLHQYEGIIPNLQRRYKQTNSAYIREWIEGYMNMKSCDSCGGFRLKKESLAIKIQDHSIADVTCFSIKEAEHFFNHLKFSEREQIIAQQILKELNQRLGFLINVGLD